MTYFKNKWYHVCPFSISPSSYNSLIHVLTVLQVGTEWTPLPLDRYDDEDMDAYIQARLLSLLDGKMMRVPQTAVVAAVGTVSSMPHTTFMLTSIYHYAVRF